MEQPAQDQERAAAGPSDRLDSWKEISAYLRRSPRTVQRWERQEGLPVHRLVHDKQGSVYAFRLELDGWWAERRIRLESQESDADGPETTTDHGASAPDPLATSARPASWRMFAGLGVAALLLVAASTAWWMLGRKPQTGAQRVRMAILPFANLTGDPAREFLGDGLTEELIAGLGRVRDLGVIARTSVMRYKGADRSVRQIGKELSVDYVLEGSVRESERRLRVTAQLIRTSDETHVWAESYDYELNDLLRIEAQVANQVAEQVRLRVPVVEARGVNADAHLAYLQGRYYWNRRTRADFERAIAFFNQAIAIDRSYAPAYSGLADSYLLLSNYGHLPVEDALPKAKEAANRALVLDESLADGHASLAFAVEIYDRDFRVAGQQFERALALNPNHVNARLWYGLMLVNLGRFEEARAQFLTGLEADPFSASLRNNVATCDFFAGRYDDALRLMRMEIERDPDRAVNHLELGRVYVQKGDYKHGIESMRRAHALAGDEPLFDAVLGYGLARAGQRAEAEAIFERLMRESGTRRVPPYYLAVLCAGLGRPDDAFHWLDQVLRERHIGALSLAVEPELASLRSDPRFQDLRRRVGLN
jgi:TolB-like protein/Tfp pilus assembly protein PilF